MSGLFCKYVFHPYFVEAALDETSDLYDTIVVKEETLDNNSSTIELHPANPGTADTSTNLNDAGAPSTKSGVAIVSNTKATALSDTRTGTDAENTSVSVVKVSVLAITCV